MGIINFSYVETNERQAKGPGLCFVLSAQIRV